MKKIAAIAVLAGLLCSSDTVADGIFNPTTQFVGNMGEGVSNPLGSGSPPPPDPCTGAIDLSEGCTLTIAIGLGP